MAELLAKLDDRMLEISYRLENAESDEDIQRYSKELCQIEAELDSMLPWYWH